MFKIAIDGPSGAGKSVIAKAVAKRLDIIYVDTGALYRAIGLYMFRNNIDPKDENSVVNALDSIKIDFGYDNGSQTVSLNGSDVTTDIRLPEISMYASAVSAIPKVREFLLDLQRSTAQKSSVIIDGRDIGTVIFPDAEVKIFLFASNEVRAKRRYLELTEKGVDTTYEAVLKDMIERDANDSNRAVAPLKPAKDAVMLDSSFLTLEETINRVIEIANERLK